MVEVLSKWPRMKEVGRRPIKHIFSTSSETVGGGEGAFSISECGIPKMGNINVHREDFSGIVCCGAFIDKTLLLRTLFKELLERGRMMKILITVPPSFLKMSNHEYAKKVS